MIKVLHVVTLIGDSGEYGGPVTVARALSKELRNQGQSCLVLGGTTAKRIDQKFGEKRVYVRSCWKRFPISSLFSFRIIFILFRETYKSDLVHLHFARDFIQYWGAVCALILQKPFVTQTHGMVTDKEDGFSRLLDLFITRRILKSATANLVLTEIEKSDLKKVQKSINPVVLPNGINFYSEPNSIRNSPKFEIAFCGRLHKTKGVGLFLEICRKYNEFPGIHFSIYGPDQGELESIHSEIESRRLRNVTYKGSLFSEEVLPILMATDLLIVPSNYDPFPLVVIESLSVGTPVLISPNCGLADKVKKIDCLYVAESLHVEDFIFNIDKLMERNIDRDRRQLLFQCSKELFDLSRIVQHLINIYQSVLESRHRSE